MIKKICNTKIDEANKKVIKTQSNKSNGNSRIASTCFKFDNFQSIIN